MTRVALAKRVIVPFGALMVLVLVGVATLQASSDPVRAGVRNSLAASSPKGKIVVQDLGGAGKAPNIPIRNYGWGIHNSSQAPGGSGGGKATFDSFSIEKLVDQHSPDIAKAAAFGTHFPQATVTLYVPGTTNPLSIFTLTNVAISGTEHDDRGATIETVSFGYSKIRWVYKASSGNKVFCFDISLGAGCP
jgi:type VI secretion system secreted protein Hcp